VKKVIKILFNYKKVHDEIAPLSLIYDFDVGVLDQKYAILFKMTRWDMNYGEKFKN
jgi:hypothetical protein